MKNFLVAVSLCTVVLAACSHTRAPTDAQLATLLRSERADAADTNAPLDGAAVGCLRAWSGDVELGSHLPREVATEEGKQACRAKLDGWLADKARNEGSFGFEDITAPPTVRRAVALLSARQLAAAAVPASRKIPAALAKAAPVVPVTVGPAAGSSVDLGAAGEAMTRAETLCQQVQQIKTTDRNDRRARFAAYCGANLRQMRGTMEGLAAGGRTAQLDVVRSQAETMANTAQSVLAAPAKP